MNIHDFFAQASLDLPALAQFLDDLEPAARLQQVRLLKAHQQAKLFEAAEGFRPIHLANLVRDGTPPLTEVIHHGRNSLPLFYFFEKRFCRPEPPSDALWGYNEGRLRMLTGPGYFVVRQASELEVVIDYRQLPLTKPVSWPPIRTNSAGLSRFVFSELQDVVRGVSRQVTIGRATREGEWLDNWFVLCRSENQ